MSRDTRTRRIVATSLFAALGLCASVLAQSSANTMNNPYRMLQNWGDLGQGIEWGAVIGIIPDGEGGTWIHHRSNPPIVKLDAAGKVTKSFGDGMFVMAHGFCMDRDGNLWAGDSGPFGDDPSNAGRGYQFFKFSQDGELLLTLGKAGVSKAGTDTFVAPTACAVTSNGDLIIADGHYPRPSTAQQDGDRLLRFTTDGEYVDSWGHKGSGPGEFDGPHALAFDSQGRLFVADRSNNRVQIFDTQMAFVDEWRHFGRPSGVAITADDTLYVADSESSKTIFGELRNPGWKNGVRIGSARDGSLWTFIDGTDPEGLGVDELGNVFAGLTRARRLDPPLLQKWVRGPIAATDLTHVEVQAILEIIGNRIDLQGKVVDIGSGTNVALGVLHRKATSTDDGEPVRGLVHHKVTEIYYILAGSATLVTGGRVESTREWPPGRGYLLVGPSMGGTSSTGHSREVSTGDIIVTPAGVFHGYSHIEDSVSYLSIRVDPDQVLPAGYVNPVLQTN